MEVAQDVGAGIGSSGSSNTDSLQSVSGPIADAGSANSKRKLEFATSVSFSANKAAATATTTIDSPKMVLDLQPKVRRRGSATRGETDPLSMKRCHSDGTISEALGAMMAKRPSPSSSSRMASSTTMPTTAGSSTGTLACQPSVRKSRNPGNLSLDLSQMDQPTFDSWHDNNQSRSSGSSSFRRTDQAAVCSCVTDFLFIGGAIAARDRELLLKHGVTHIINCAATVTPDYFPNDFYYHNIRLRDHSSQDIARHFYSTFDFIENARCRGGKIFVHCVKGISRSPTMAIAYLMWYKRMSMYKALDFVRQARPGVDPNAGFIFQLTEWEHLHLDGKLQFQQQRTMVFRIEIAHDHGSTVTNSSNHPSSANGRPILKNDVTCQNDADRDDDDDRDLPVTSAAEKPLIIGPLTTMGEDDFHRPTKEISQSSFVVSSAEYMCIWCGSEVNQVQVEAAQHAMVLLQRYESFPTKCEIVYHGQEGAAFWHLVDALHPKN